MNFKFKHLRYQFLGQILFFLLYLIIIGSILLIARKQLNKSEKSREYLLILNKNIASSYSIYTEFVSYQNSNEGAISASIVDHTALFNQLLTQITDTLIYSSTGIKINPLLGEKLEIKDSLLNAVAEYRRAFNFLSLALQEKGTKSTGNLHGLRTISENMVQLVNFHLSNAEIIQKTTLLKSLEAEFLFAYNIEVFNTMSSLLDEINNLNTTQLVSGFEFDELKNLLSSYQTKLVYLSNVYQRIGSIDKNGLLFDFELNYTKLNNHFTQFSNVIEHSLLIRNRIRLIIAILLELLFSVIFAFLIWSFYLHIKKPFEEAIGFSYQLSKGRQPAKDLPLDAPYEFTDLNANLNALNNSVKDKKKFIDHLLKQRFDADLILMGKNDAFGKTLLALKEYMKKAREEQIRHGEENQLRRYMNEGIAKFADILRMNNTNITTLSDVFIRELVKYLDALQGGLFLIDESKPDVIYLSAAFAYNRKKYITKTIKMGEGMVGTCAVEKKSINLLEMPADYIEITSGLGDAPPNNLLLVPALHEGEIIGVVEIASLKKFENHQIEVAETIASSLAATIINARVNSRTSELLGKSQQQAAEMSEQEEEMRQNMEELKATQEESSRREEELEGMLNTLNHAFYIVEYDLDGQIIKTNPKTLTLINKSLDSVLGKTHAEIFSENTKADSQLFAKVSNGDTVELLENVTVNGKNLQMNNTFSPIHSKTGKAIRIINIISVNY